MTKISDENFSSFLNKQIDLSSCVLTNSLGTISRFNIFSRIFHRNDLDSKEICENLKNRIDDLRAPLQGTLKVTALVNLNSMKLKFAKSKDQNKANDCSKIIDQIIGKINIEEAPPKQNRNQAKNNIGNVSPKKEQKKIETVTSTEERKMPTSSTKRHIDPNGVQAKLIEVISKSDQKVETTTMNISKMVPNIDKINKIEAGVTEEDRKRHGFKRHLIFIRHENKYYFNALVASGTGFNRVCGQTLVSADAINEQIKVVKQTGSFNLGALLRQRMNEMNIGFKEQ